MHPHQSSLSSACSLIFCVLVFLAFGTSNGTHAQESQRPVVAFGDILFGDIGEKTKGRFDETAFLASLEAALNHTRKFRVVTRNKKKLGALRAEQTFAQSSASAGNAADQGQLLAAGFVVVPTVIRFRFGRSHRDMPNISGKYFRKDYGELDVEIEVLDSASGELVGSYRVADSFTSEETIVNDKGGLPPASRFTGMTDDVGQRFADQLISTVFPMKVIAVSGGQIYINRGADGGLSEGDILDVFRVGTKLIDPDTNELLGTVEDKLGNIELIQVKPKVAVAKPISVSADITKADIVRKP